jgi:hypothetical protein
MELVYVLEWDGKPEIPTEDLKLRQKPMLLLGIEFIFSQEICFAIKACNLIG